MKKIQLALLCLICLALLAGCREPETNGITSGAHVFENGVIRHCACGNAVVTDEAGTVTRAGDCLTLTAQNGAVGCDGTLLDWTPWDGSSGKLPEATGNYYLNKSFTVSDETRIPSQAHIRLDLNGQTVTGIAGQAEGNSVKANGKRILSSEAGSKLVITDSSKGKTGALIGGTHVKQGGGTMLLSGDTTLYNLTVKDGSASKSNGGNLLVSGNLYLLGVTVQNGTSTNSGGNLYINNRDGNLVFFNTVFSGGKANTDGGSIFLRAGHLDLHGCRFSGGDAGGNGGNLFCYGDEAPAVNMYHCTFEKGNALSNGGNIHTDGPTYMENCTVKDGKAGGFAGNVRFGTYTTGTVKNCQFLGGTGRNGGNLRFSGVTMEMIGCTVTGGTSVKYGGNFYVEAGTVKADKDTVFSGGKAVEADGGNLFILSAATLELYGTLVKDGYAGDSGGNICNEGTLLLDSARVLGGSSSVLKENSSLYIITVDNNGMNKTVIRDSVIDGPSHVFTWAEKEGARKENGLLEISGNTVMAELSLNVPYHGHKTLFHDLGADADIRIVLEEESLIPYTQISGQKFAMAGSGVDVSKISYVGTQQHPSLQNGFLVW